MRIIEEGRWLCIDWPLTKDSVVFDIGGFNGEWTDKTSRMFDGEYHIYEPITSFYKKIVEYLGARKNIFVHNFAVGSVERKVVLGIEGDSTSEYLYKPFPVKEECRQININSIIPDKVDVMAINCEGGEYDILPALIESGKISNVKYLQIQFHNFVPGAEEKHKQIFDDLSKTHNRIYSWEWVWEVWEIK
jgi:FkbM family methyltransferase